MALFIFLIVILTGVAGYMLIENFSLINALYMTIITVSTVGFSEVSPLSLNGKLFTMGLIVFNIGAFTYAVSVLTSFIVDGDFKDYFKLIKMTGKINSLNNHVIVCGYGRLGIILCEDLALKKVPFLVVDSDITKIEILKQKGYLHFQGDATIDETISHIGIKRAKTLITTMPSDSSNVYVVLAARELSSDIDIISRANEEANISKLKRAGASHVILPEHIGGSYMAALVNGDENIEMGNWGY